MKTVGRRAFLEKGKKKIQPPKAQSEQMQPKFEVDFFSVKEHYSASAASCLVLFSWQANQVARQAGQSFPGKIGQVVQFYFKISLLSCISSGFLFRN